MEPTNNTSGNILTNIRQLLLSDKRMLVTVVGLGILVIVFITMVVMYFSGSKKESLITGESPTALAPSGRRPATSAQQQKIPATLTLVLSNKKTVYKVGDTISFRVIGDTAGTQVRGYDAVFKFDPTKVSFASEKNLYTVFPYRRRILGNWVIITGMQPLSSGKKSIFSKTPLMGLTFKATGPGRAYFPLSYIPDSTNDSNLIDTASNDMLSNAAGIVVQIIK